MRLFAAFTSLFLLGLLTAPTLGDEPDVRQIVTKADQATDAVKMLSYQAEAWGEGVLKDFVPRFRATVKIQAGPTGQLPYLRVEGTKTAPESANADPFHVVVDGKQIISLDQKTKVCNVGDLPQAISLGAEVLATVCLKKLVDPMPFNDELQGDSLRYEGQKSVAGTECHVIYVVYAGGRPEARWYFGVEDFLPRRVDRVFRTPTREGIRVLELSEIDTAPKFDETTFATAVPQGYTEKRYQSPAPARRRSVGLLAVGSQAPDWTLKTAEGQSVSLAGLRGKVVVLDFWATWCVPCVRAMPGIQKLHDHFKGQPVAVFGVNAREHRKADPAGFMKTKGFTYAQLLKGDQVADAYGVQGLPTFYVIGPDGRIAHAATGYNPADEEALTKLIDRLVKGIE